MGARHAGAPRRKRRWRRPASRQQRPVVGGASRNPMCRRHRAPTTVPGTAAMVGSVAGSVVGSAAAVRAGRRSAAPRPCTSRHHHRGPLRPWRRRHRRLRHRREPHHRGRCRPRRSLGRYHRQDHLCAHRYVHRHCVHQQAGHHRPPTCRHHRHRPVPVRRAFRRPHRRPRCCVHPARPTRGRTRQVLTPRRSVGWIHRRPINVVARPSRRSGAACPISTRPISGPNRISARPTSAHRTSAR